MDQETKLQAGNIMDFFGTGQEKKKPKKADGLANSTTDVFDVR